MSAGDASGNDNDDFVDDGKFDWNSLFTNVSAYFMVIATVLGTGILALPMKLADSGFAPFVVTYLVCFVMQALILVYLVELLQKAKVLLDRTQLNEATGAPADNPGVIALGALGASRSGAARAKHSKLGDDVIDADDIQLVDDDDDDDDDDGDSDGGSGDAVENRKARKSNAQGTVELDEEDDAVNDSLASGGGDVPRVRGSKRSGGDGNGGAAKKSSNHGPDLHYLGVLFLGKWSRIIFDACVMIHFISILISYGLAASQSYSMLFGIDDEHSDELIAPFILLFTLIIVFGAEVLRGVITFFTFAKGMLLIVVVFVTAIVANAAKVDYDSSWVFIGRPFLIGTVALGGAGNIAPVAFAKVKQTRKHLRDVTIAMVAGLFTVWILNVFWAYFLLEAVPQLGPAPSLEYAAAEGEIATTPLIQVIEHNYPQFSYIAWFVDIFITVSISVSFLTVGMAFIHVLDGFVRSWQRARAVWWLKCTPIRNLGQATSCTRNFPWRRAFLYVVSFSFIYFMAQANPRGFLIIMERLTSAVLNLEAGLFIVLMLYKGRYEYGNVHTIYTMPEWCFKMSYVVMAYFLFAVVYDILLTGFEIFSGGEIEE